MREYLFIYGTLKPSEADDEVAEVVKRLRRVGPATVPGRLYDFGDYPGAVVHSNSATKIHGEVFELPIDGRGSLKTLDQYEEFDASNPEQSLFLRQRISAKLFDGRRVNCWIYVYNKDPGNARQITSGDYSQFKVA
jgi:gamma-glutamylcyclotransferase (GGCT)/AIG2-like uncharacterized protein YtfP